MKKSIRAQQIALPVARNRATACRADFGHSHSCRVRAVVTAIAAAVAAAVLIAVPAASAQEAQLGVGGPGMGGLRVDLAPDFDPAAAGALAPAEILAEVRQEGFYPVGRLVQRGSVYVLYAVDQDDIDVLVTVDAATGRVLRVRGAVAHFGGPGTYGWRSIWREHPPAPPDEAPAARPRRDTLRHYPRPVAVTPVHGAAAPLEE